MNNKKGFALPTVLIASIVMLTVLLVAVVSTSAIRSSLNAQYYNQLADIAADAGVAYARACLAASNGVPGWSGQTLRPETDCSGKEIPGKGKFIDQDTTSNISTSFVVEYPIFDSDGRVTSLSASGYANLFRESNDSLVWRKYTGYSSTDLPVSGFQSIAVSSNGNHSAGIHAGKVYTWGDNTYGQLGQSNASGSNITYAYSATPVKVYSDGVLKGKIIKEVACGLDFTVALDTDGRVYAWGRNHIGQLGNNNSGTDSSNPVSVSDNAMLQNKTITKIVAGSRFVMALDSDGKLYSWGDNSSGQLGVGYQVGSFSYPLEVTSNSVLNGKRVVSISANNSVAMALTSDHRAFGWGSNRFDYVSSAATGAGQYELYSPVSLDKLDYNTLLPLDNIYTGVFDGYKRIWKSDSQGFCDINDVAVGGSYSLATITTKCVTNDYKSNVYAWGGTYAMPLSLALIPTRTIGVPTDKQTFMIAAGGGNALSTSNELDGIVTWAYKNSTSVNLSIIGSNIFRDESSSPKKIVQMLVGEQCYFVLTRDGTVYTWGTNTKGQMGVGTNANVDGVVGSDGMLKVEFKL